MRNLFALIGVAVVGFGGAGWYLGWYKLHVNRGPEGNVRIETDVDTRKVSEDSGRALQQVGAFLGDRLDKAAVDAKAGPQPAPVSTPGPVTPPQAGAATAVFDGWPFNVAVPTPGGK